MKDIKPVMRAAAARYPTKEAALEHPELLAMLPGRWKRNLRVASAAGMAASLAMASGCGILFRTPEPPLAGVPLPPAYVSEAEAEKFICDAAGAALPGLAGADAPNGGRIVFVAGNGTDGYRVVETESPAIDLFDAGSGVGFAYIDASGGDAPGEIEYTNRVAEADADSDYVLVIPAVIQNDDAADKASIQKQVADFIAWLKAEEII